MYQCGLVRRRGWSSFGMAGAAFVLKAYEVPNIQREPQVGRGGGIVLRKVHGICLLVMKVE
jgi:hypothetical protein